MALNLNQAQAASSPNNAYPASQHGVVGFAFDLTSSSATTIRIAFKLKSDPSANYCTTLNPGRNLIHYTNIHRDCFAAGGVALTAAQLDDVAAIEWMVPTRYAQTTPFSFCINAITPLVQ
jgi:hypothetical protein